MICETCQDDRWVCEDHPDKPWRDGDGCECGGAGRPCPACNAGSPLALTPGAIIVCSGPAWRDAITEQN